MTKFYRIMYTLFDVPVRFLMRIRVVNPEKLPQNRGCILCANHTSMLDVLVLSAALNRQVRYMAKKELFRIPVLKHFLSALGAYPVDRGGADVQSIRKTISMLENNELIGIFPQGTRHPAVNPAQTPIKHGVGMIAWHAKATVIPAYIQTSGNRVRFFHRNEVILGDPIPFEELGFNGGGVAQYKAATEKIFTAVCALGGYERNANVPMDEKASGEPS